LIDLFAKGSGIHWNLLPTADKITLKTPEVTAVVERKTGSVTFLMPPELALLQKPV